MVPGPEFVLVGEPDESECSVDAVERDDVDVAGSRGGSNLATYSPEAVV
jgi:hypothetical protein